MTYKKTNPDTKNNSNRNLESLSNIVSNIEIKGRLPSSSFNCVTPTTSNQVAVNKCEDYFGND